MEFALVVLSSLACFVAGFFLLKPSLRRIFPTGIFGAALYLEGLWMMVNFIISGIWQDNHIMDIIKDCISLVVALCIIYTVYKLIKKLEKQRKNMKQSSENGKDI